MTTKNDHGDHPPQMLDCPLGPGSQYPSRVLALRDLRTANGRDETTGAGHGNSSWIALTLGMIVLDTLTGPRTDGVGEKWKTLLTTHNVGPQDAALIYKLRCSVLHGYGIPKLSEARRLQLTDDQTGYAIDTFTKGVVSVSVPVFCRCLVERIAFEAGDQWDQTLIDTRAPNLRLT